MDVVRYDYVTVRDPHIRGLMMLPFAALTGLMGLWDLGALPLPGGQLPHVPGRWFAFGFVLACAASWAIRAWYNVKYGVVEQHWTRSQLIPIFAVVACLPIAIALSGIVHVPLGPVLVAVVLAGVGIHRFPLRSHYLLAAAVLLAFALLRPFGMPSGALLNALFDFTISAVLTIVGVGDHRLYVSSLHEVPALV